MNKKTTSMDIIYIPQLLKMPERSQSLQFNQYISGLESLTPVKGIFKIRHGGNFLDLKLEADTIITLTCDRCLQTFNHRLKVDYSEIILLNDQADSDFNLPLEREISEEDLWESLPSDGELNIDEWIYEQLSLALPLRSLCGNDCQPPTISDSQITPSAIVDKRWASLAKLMVNKEENP